jgi:hypothetical protein
MYRTETPKLNYSLEALKLNMKKKKFLVALTGIKITRLSSGM